MPTHFQSKPLATGYKVKWHSLTTCLLPTSKVVFAKKQDDSTLLVLAQDSAIQTPPRPTWLDNMVKPLEFSLQKNPRLSAGTAVSKTTVEKNATSALPKSTLQNKPNGSSRTSSRTSSRGGTAEAVVAVAVGAAAVVNTNPQMSPM